MRDFMKQLADMPKYKIINFCLLGLLILFASRIDILFDNFVIYQRISKDFYTIHICVYISLTILCLIVLYVNHFRGKKCWYFLFIVYWDVVMGLYPLVLKNIDTLVYALEFMVLVYLMILVLIELVHLRYIRLNLKKVSWWDGAMKIVTIIYMIKTIGTLPLFLK